MWASLGSILSIVSPVQESGTRKYSSTAVQGRHAPREAGEANTRQPPLWDQGGAYLGQVVPKHENWDPDLRPLVFFFFVSAENWQRAQRVFLYPDELFIDT